MILTQTYKATVVHIVLFCSTFQVTLGKSQNPCKNVMFMHPALGISTWKTYRQLQKKKRKNIIADFSGNRNTCWDCLSNPFLAHTWSTVVLTTGDSSEKWPCAYRCDSESNWRCDTVTSVLQPDLYGHTRSRDEIEPFMKPLNYCIDLCSLSWVIFLQIAVG